MRWVARKFLFVCFLCAFAHTHALAQPQKNPLNPAHKNQVAEKREEKKGAQAQARPQITEWLAFGSGCRGSSKAESSDVQLSSLSNDTLRAQFTADRFELRFPEGGKGVRECAFRVTYTPPQGMQIKDVLARIPLLAHKSDGVHLRSHMILLIGDHLVSKRTWDLKPEDFARSRDETFMLVSGRKSDEQIPPLPCGKPQIIGLDLTFEGRTDKPQGTRPTSGSLEHSLRLQKSRPLEIEILSVPCEQR